MSRQQIAKDLILFKIDASQCDLRIGDRVMPRTVIGRDWETGELLQIDSAGEITAVSFSGADHALVILVKLSEFAE